MDNVPKALRLHIGILGRVNVGKSSFLNMIMNQNASIISDAPGTTTDVVERTMELLPIGPVVFHDTGGIDDVSALAEKRIKKTEGVFNRADVFLLIIEPNLWGEYEEKIRIQALIQNVPLLILINKIDLEKPNLEFLELLKTYSNYLIQISCADRANYDSYRNRFKENLKMATEETRNRESILIGDLIASGGLGIIIVPIDLQAPKGRLILPQVQTIRDALDHDGAILVVKEREYAYFLSQLKIKPKIVICDSQVVLKMTADTPLDVKCTTFSILFARHKGDLVILAKGAAAIDQLKANDKILIAEGCSHHAIEDDIGRVKIPRWLKQYTGVDLIVDFCAGRDFPENLNEYKLVILCGSCMLNRKETLSRIAQAEGCNVPTTNYGICISVTQGVIRRVLEPFPAALRAYKEALSLRRIQC